jgi:hypothetical protein
MDAMAFYNKILDEARRMREIQSKAYGANLLVFDALIEAIKAHEPVPCAPGSEIMDCHGCDSGPHAEFLADAPCSTLDIIADALMVSR